MNKKILVAALGLAFGGLAQAQTSVVLYGKIDEAVQLAKTSNGTVSNLAGSESGTRWGLKGSEDLGGGLRAIFQLESGFDASNGAFIGGGIFNRISTVGLRGGFGTIELGKKDTPLFNVLDMADPFGSSTTASLQYSLWAAGSTPATATTNTSRGYDRRFSNGLIYTSPNLSGFSAQAVYSLGENNTVNGTDETRGNTFGVGLTYVNGPAYLGFAYNRAEVDQRFGLAPFASVVTEVTPHKYTALAGSYDFGVVKLYGAAYRERQNNKALSTAPVNALTDVDQRVYWFSVSAPVSPMSTVAATIGRVNDKTSRDQDAHQWGVGYFYNLSKRTSLYTTYGSIDNKNALTSNGVVVSPIVTISGNGNSFATSGGRSSGFDFGVVHSF